MKTKINPEWKKCKGKIKWLLDKDSYKSIETGPKPKLTRDYLVVCNDR